MNFFKKSINVKGELLYSKGWNLYNDGEYEKALATFIKAASTYDNTKAQYQTGKMYSDGIGVDVDYGQAVIWLKQAAEKGHKEAQADTGYAYYVGNGVTQDFREAMHWFRLSAKQGHAVAEYNIGIMYSKGEGVIVNHNEAFQWYLKSSQQNYDEGTYQVGSAYLKGIGVGKDIEQALTHLQSAAEREVKLAQRLLGLCYLHGFQGISKDPKQAIELLTKSDFPASLILLAHTYEEGVYVNQDLDRAKYFYDRCNSNRSTSMAMFDLGFRYWTMNDGDKSTELALFWLKKVAAMGDIPALTTIGCFYLTHKSRDINEAYSYLSRAAQIEQVPLALAQLNVTRKRNEDEEYSVAMKWYYKSSNGDTTVEEGCMSWLPCVGYLFQKGLGVQKCFATAHDLYTRTLQEFDGDDSDANMCLGLLYLKGLGVDQNGSKALSYFKRSAKTINTYTYNLIGDAYQFGYGVLVDHEKAMEWYMKGAKYNDRYSQLNIGKMYLNSSNYSDDACFAKIWFRKSHENGCRGALEFLQTIDEDDPSKVKQLLTNERLAREAAEKELQKLQEELARMKASDEPAVPMILEAQNESKSKKVFQFFHV